MWWLTSQKNGASAPGLQRALGLGSYKTAWRTSSGALWYGPDATGSAGALRLTRPT